MFFHNPDGESTVSPGLPPFNQRGSFLVAGTFFTLFFLFLAVLGLDLGRYFLLAKQTQNVADGAVKAAGQAFNQVRTLENLNREKILLETLRYLKQERGYTTDVYEYRRAMNSGDIQLEVFPPDANHPDTYYRVGVNALQVFEPFFLPGAIFGDDSFTIQAHAVAEVVPVFSQNNLYDESTLGPPIPPLQFAVFSEQNIKTETMNCLKVDGSYHANNGQLTLETMQGGGCGMGLDNVLITGNVESGDTTGGNGNVKLEDVSGVIQGDVIHEGTYTNENGPDVGGTVRNEDPGSIPTPRPPTPEAAPGDYPEPICVFNGDHTITAPGNFDDGNSDCYDGGTIYVKGDLKIQDFSMNGDYTLVADGMVKFENNSDLSSRNMMIYSVNGKVKMEEMENVTINATLYAPSKNVRIETSENFTLNGGVVGKTEVKMETTETMSINFRPHDDLLPKTLRQPGSSPNKIPDYWHVYLID